MGGPEADARRYREKAEVFRTLAGIATSEITQGTCLHLARAYEDLAARLDLIAAVIEEHVQLSDETEAPRAGRSGV